VTRVSDVDSPEQVPTESYKELLESIDGIVWEADASTFAFTFVSPQAESMLGYPISDWFDPDFWPNNIHSEDREFAISFCATATARGEDHQFEYRMRKADGKYVWLKDIVSLVVVSDGRKLLRGVMLDITEQKETEFALKQSEQRFRQLAENIKEVFWMHSPGVGEMVYVSPAYLNVWGRTCESLYENPRSFIDSIIPEDIDRVLAELAKGPTTGFEVEYRIQRPDGSVRWIWDRGFPVLGADGDVYRVAGLAEDITERKKLEEQLLQSQKMEAIGQLAGGVAHDFNNLLTAIIGYSDLVLRKLPPDDPIAKHVEQIRRSGERAAGLTRQLLAFSRKQILQPRILDLNSVVREIEEILRRLIGEDIELIVDIDPSLGVVRADPGQIEQVLLNLAVNARDAMNGSGKLEISTTNVFFDEAAATSMELSAGEYISLSVKDTGTGIDAELIEHIFEPFFTTKETGKGTGLGLSTVYGIVRQSEGHAAVESALGVGTTFNIFLPRVPDVTITHPEVRPGNIESSGSETILLVEDETVVRDLIENILIDNGYQVHRASNGLEALDIAVSHGLYPNLLITDVVMPGISGCELASRFEAMYSGIKVIFMSGYTDDQALGADTADGVRSYIQKPFHPNELVEKVRAVLDNSSRAIHVSA
jgi:PAS domain S-box